MKAWSEMNNWERVALIASWAALVSIFGYAIAVGSR